MNQVTGTREATTSEQAKSFLTQDTGRSGMMVPQQRPWGLVKCSIFPIRLLLATISFQII